MSREECEADLRAIVPSDLISEDEANCIREVRISIELVPLPPEERADVTDSFRRLYFELNTAESDPARVLRYWRRIEEIAPTVAHSLAVSPIIRDRSLLSGVQVDPPGGFLNESLAREFVEKIDDPQIKRLLEQLHIVMLNLSIFERVRPAGTFDLLYFYTVLSRWLRESDFEILSENATQSATTSTVKP